MWNDRLRLAESVEEQWRALNAVERRNVVKALETIDDNPIAGAPLVEPLRGLWSYRVHHIRIVYRIVPEARFVVILSITRV
jgi:mRNA-degrading endonuclease RelE of RelBE toxin-antitoxin system